ncbi:MAG: hypothetical protein HGA25_00780 [Clostridiales bacterium]|nr:hypothetical protein [Clostridiales bacterium]
MCIYGKVGFNVFFTDNKLEARINELKELRYKDRTSLVEMLSLEDNSGIVNPEPPSDKEEWKTIAIGERWQGRDLYLWLKKELQIPKRWRGKKVLGIFDYGNTGADTISFLFNILFLILPKALG